MLFKKGVTREGVAPCVFYAIGVAEGIYRDAGHVCVVTSLTDSHADRPASLHNKGLAVDFRTRDLPEPVKAQVFASLKAVLDPQGFDVVLEASHIHAEYDPVAKESWLTMVP